jgi:hypothetical protein
MINKMDLLNKVLETRTIDQLSSSLYISPSTIKRWISLDRIPSNYEIDIKKILSIPINYSTYSSKEKDQFFTSENNVKYCYDTMCFILERYNEDASLYTYIEPSAGGGNFLKVLPSDRTIAMDIEPKAHSIIESDFLSWTPPPGKYIVIGNPPFGLRGNLALRFINHSYPFADFVCFILPQLFESDGKGVPRKRVRGYNLIHSEKLQDSTFYYPNSDKVVVHTVFQIWSKNHLNPQFIIKDIKQDYVNIYSISDGGTSSSTRNKDKIGKCDFYLPSTCFGEANVKAYSDFERLPNRRGYGIILHDKRHLNSLLDYKWSTVSFKSTNSSYNLRSSQIMSVTLNFYHNNSYPFHTP